MPQPRGTAFSGSEDPDQHRCLPTCIQQVTAAVVPRLRQSPPRGNFRLWSILLTVIFDPSGFGGWYRVRKSAITTFLIFPSLQRFNRLLQQNLAKSAGIGLALSNNEEERGPCRKVLLPDRPGI